MHGIRPTELAGCLSAAPKLAAVAMEPTRGSRTSQAECASFSYSRGPHAVGCLLDTLDAPAPALPPRGTQRRPFPARDWSAAAGARPDARPAVCPGRLGTPHLGESAPSDSTVHRERCCLGARDHKRAKLSTISPQLMAAAAVNFKRFSPFVAIANQ